MIIGVQLDTEETIFILRNFSDKLKLNNEPLEDIKKTENYWTNDYLSNTAYHNYRSSG